MERSHYGAISKGAASQGWLLYKIPDAANTGKKPFDFVGVAPNGLAVALELKEAKAGCGLMALLAPHQLAWLQAYQGLGAYALIGLKVEREPRIMVYRLDTLGAPQFAFGLRLEGGLFVGWPKT